ncbi:MAG: glycosyltransferase [Gemmatimonadales bacterium]|nr:glycosyltransferase [Gemmatimonadales bacterium]
MPATGMRLDLLCVMFATPQVHGRGRDTAIVIKGESRYGVLRRLLDDLAEGLRACGLRVFIFDTTAPEAAEHARLSALLLSGRAAFAVSLAGWGSLIMLPDGRRLWNAVDIPFLGWIGDPPYFSTNLQVSEFTRGVALLHDETYGSLLEALGPSAAPWAWLPVGGELASRPVPADARGAERPVVSMSLAPLAPLEAQLAELPTARRRVVEDVVDAAARDGGFVLHDALLQAWNGPLGEPSIAESADARLTLTRIMRLTYSLAHARRRWAMVPQLLALPVDIHGEGWDAVAADATRARLCPVLPIERMRERIARAPLLLNVNPPIVRTAHDRVLQALGAATPVLSDSTPYLESEFAAAGALATFPVGADDLGDRFATLLADPARLAEMGARAHAAIADRHTWRHRAAELLRILAASGRALAAA